MSFVSNLGRELTYVSALFRTMKWMKGVAIDSPQLVPDDIEAVVDRHPDNIAFLFEGQATTYREFDARANRYANWALSEGMKAGDCVALFMLNKPDYVACWYGLSKVGVVTALINNNLTGQGLAHCVTIAKASHVVVDADIAPLWASAAGLVGSEVRAFATGGSAAGCADLDAALAQVSGARPDRSHRAHLLGKDLCLYVYTSGTTGLPKAAKLSHSRTQTMSRAFIGAVKGEERDRIYVALPLYHGTGGLCGVGVALNTGGTIVLRRKFSASAFWDDVSDNGCTIFVYIGELCRYLINQPPHQKERAHRLKAIFGNGLRPEVWEKFQPRFNIPKIVEFYGSTEGNVAMANYEGKMGSIGRIPKYMDGKVFHSKLVKFDVEAEQVVRGPDGFCVLAEDGEVGEAIGKIGETARERFDGYGNDTAQTEKKILRDVFEKGDAWFRTGDLMKKDADGYFYFVDRIGDTFRWKSENVSTNEVGEAISVFPGVTDANVYGVAVPHHDGRAGMAAMTADAATLDLAAFKAHVDANLPVYARPLFLRLTPQAEVTGTFKYKKTDLVRDGFDPAKVSDPLFVYDPQAGGYVPLDAAAYEKVLAGGFKF
jgi:fatty-acyl-CoA synthase